MELAERWGFVAPSTSAYGFMAAAVSMYNTVRLIPDWPISEQDAFSAALAGVRSMRMATTSALSDDSPPLWRTRFMTPRRRGTSSSSSVSSTSSSAPSCGCAGGADLDGGLGLTPMLIPEPHDLDADEDEL
eukprot:5858869-Pyramimonas_sp.AAC.1